MGFVTPYAYFGFGAWQALVIGSYLDAVSWPYPFSIAKWPLAVFVGFTPLIGTAFAIYAKIQVLGTRFETTTVIIVVVLVAFLLMVAVPPVLRRILFKPVVFVDYRPLAHPLKWW